MPVAAAHAKDGQIFQHYHHLLPKSPRFHGQLSPTSIVTNSEGIFSHERVTLVSEYGHLRTVQAGAHGDATEQFFSTHSPPLINLSPNLSPIAEPQRTSPFYDFRETTRRRGLNDLQNHQMQNPSQLYSGIIEESGRKSESPTRKRRKTSVNIIDLTNSPSPPPTRDNQVERAGVGRRRASSQRRVSIEQRCNTPRARRSPGTRRRTARDRNSGHQNDISPDRRAFQPPVMNQIHPASLPVHGQTAQHPVVIDVDQVAVSAPVTMTPYAIPVCTGPHHIPVCTTAHIPVCNSQPTWSIPTCNVQIPSCSMQHIPACSLPQIPFPPTSIPPIFHHSHHTTNHIPRQHMVPPTHFTGNTRQHPEEEIQLLSENRPPPTAFPLQAALHHHGAAAAAAAFNTSPPVLLQEPTVHPTPHDIYGPFQRYYARHRAVGRNGRLRSMPPPPPPYPGFLLHFLAMLGNPPLHQYGREFRDEATEVENYEVGALLNLAERLGEAKPRGLTKAEIEQLPAYRFNKETHHSDMDQTSCVVCMCDFENRQLLRVLPCSHEFHTKCVDKWLKTNRTCPICRADATATEAANQSD